MAENSATPVMTPANTGQLPKVDHASLDGLDVKHVDDGSGKLVDQIEMIGEEQAAGFQPHSQVTAGMRYLHCSRTIHQLVTDRNRAVGLFFAVGSLLLTASSALLHASPQGDLIIPAEKIQKWCLPITFGTLTIMAALVAFLLIRTRVGLIYEVAKMNALLGLPLGRVSRNSPLSIHFLMQLIISLAGGACAGVFSVFIIAYFDSGLENVAVPSIIIGVVVTVALMILSIEVVNHVTADERLKKVGK